MDLDSVITATLVLLYRNLANGRDKVAVPQGFITYIVSKYTGVYSAEVFSRLRRRKFSDYIDIEGTIRIKNMYYIVVSINKDVETLCDSICMEYLHDKNLQNLVTSLLECLKDPSQCKRFPTTIRQIAEAFRKKYIMY